MKEGMDQINYVQSTREEEKRERDAKRELERAKKKDKIKIYVPKSPEPVEGQKPTKKLNPAELKKYKLQLAEDFIQESKLFFFGDI